MAVTAWKSAGTCANDNSSGSLPWEADNLVPTALVGNELTSDNDVFAKTLFSSGATSNFLKATNFGFTTSDVPTGSSIDGFEIEVRQYREATASVVSTVIKLVKAGSIVGNDFGTSNDWATSEAVVVYGNSTQLGGQSWTVSDITSSSFGLVLAFNSGTSRTSPSGSWSFVDQIRVRIFYTDPSSVNQRSCFLTFFV